jgi:hypothetical protein
MIDVADESWWQGQRLEIILHFRGRNFSNLPPPTINILIPLYCLFYEFILLSL